MSNPDILSKADKILRPVLNQLEHFPWLRIEGCCAGHKQEDNLWLEINVLGSSGLHRLMDLLRILDSKLAGTDCRIDCLLSYQAGMDNDEVPHGWIPAAIEAFWPEIGDWRRNQSMIVETMLSSIEEFRHRVDDTPSSEGAINYCPFCSSTFIKIELMEKAGSHRYKCGDCDMVWTMLDPTV
jgi:hypothetical protein